MSGAQETRSEGPSLFWLAYGQVAALLGAFSLLVFVTHFVDVGLKGVLQQAFEGWVQYVRPAIGGVAHWVIGFLPEAWRFVVPVVVQDYMAVGIMLFFSFARAIWALGFSIETPIRNFIVIFLGLLLAWPLFGFGMLEGLTEPSERIEPRNQWRLLLLWIAPLIYLGLLFAANAWLSYI